MFIGMIQFFISFTIAYTLIKISIHAVNSIYNNILERIYLWQVRRRISEILSINKIIDVS
jgi:hypothetical protein